MDSSELYQEAVTTFRALLDEATRAGEPEPTAMTLATADASGRISARVVLLKNVDEAGFCFYTNYHSAKAAQLAAHRQAALCVLWKTLRDGVQVRIEGEVEKVDAIDSDAYFASRARLSQIGAWASLQSQTLPARDDLDARVAEFERKFAGQDVPRPPHWGGYRLVPQRIEFWTDRPHRLHERRLFTRGRDGWSEGLLYP